MPIQQTSVHNLLPTRFFNVDLVSTGSTGFTQLAFDYCELDHIDVCSRNIAQLGMTQYFSASGGYFHAVCSF